MVGFNIWCNVAQFSVGAHALSVLTGRPDRLVAGGAAIAAAIPAHYAAEEHIGRILARLGKPAAAQFILGKLPTTKSMRSGDLGEVLAAEFIGEHTSYVVPIKRLRWKDHRNMAMRGDDVLGFEQLASGRLNFLKAEAKSRITLSAAVVADARVALDKDNGLPSAQALSFISAQLLATGNPRLADAIDDAQLRHGIAPQSVRHMLFTFSGNDPTPLLGGSLQEYRGTMSQHSVGVRIDTHANFVGSVYELVIANANNN